MDAIGTAISASAVAISLASLYFARRSWMQDNRPTVIAFVAEHALLDSGTVYKLCVANTGNRPATNVRLNAPAVEIDKLIAPVAEADKRKMIHDCFAAAATIPVLKHGEELSTAFGGIGPGNQWLNFGKEMTIEITYNDLEGKTFSSMVPIKVCPREGFGGGVWSNGK